MLSIAMSSWRRCDRWMIDAGKYFSWLDYRSIRYQMTATVLREHAVPFVRLVLCSASRVGRTVIDETSHMLDNSWTTVSCLWFVSHLTDIVRRSISSSSLIYSAPDPICRQRVENTVSYVSLMNNQLAIISPWSTAWLTSNRSSLVQWVRQTDDE